VTGSQTQPRHSRLTALQAIQAALTGRQSVDSLCRTVHRELGQVLDATGLVVALYDELSQMVEVVYQMEGDQELPGGSFPLGEGFISEVIRTRQPRFIRHWSAEGPRVQVQYATGTPGLPESTITVPLMVGERIAGVVSLQSHAVAAYDEDDLLLVQAVAAHIAPTLELRQHGGVDEATRRVSELEAILSSMHDALLILDRAGRIVSLNPPARAIFGPIGAGIVLGQRLDHEQWGNWPLGAQAVAKALGPVLEALLQGEAQRDLEVEITGDGRRVLSFSSAAFRDPAGNLAGGVVVFRDVTTQRDVARLKDELLSMASHDLRTPAAVVKIQAQLAKRELRGEERDTTKLVGRVDTIVEQTERLNTMLNMLMDLSRIEAGRLDLVREPMDLVKSVRRVAHVVQMLTNRHTFDVEAPPVLEGAWDAGRLEQVLQNLLTNAVKYSPEGGRIVVRVVAEATEAIVAVSDPGIGIEPAELPRLTERFYRVSGTRKLEGSGLGLHICQAIVSAHGGRIWAASAGPGQGSTFTIALPYR
jgi:signal transduction histidine kinase